MKSGNPAGRPPGVNDKRTLIRQLLEQHAEDLVAKVVELAKAGDTTALRICIDRLIPPVRAKDDPIRLSSLTGSLADSGRVVLDALADERLTPEEGASFLSALATQARIVEADEIEKRVMALEKASESGNTRDA